MIRIFIIGTGNLGFHLCRAFYALNEVGSYSAFAKADTQKTFSRLKLVGYLNKSGSAIADIAANQYFNYQDIPDCDLIIIAVPDDSIIEVASHLPKSKAIVVHTSGTVSMDALENHKRRGVFYLPQSFSISKTPDFSSIPLCLEGNHKEVLQLLRIVGQELTPRIVEMNSAQRKQLHLAAVYMNNFVNHCYVKSHEILNRAGIPTDALDHLMRETMFKALELSPSIAQTGPAKRNDAKTIAAHLELLPESERDLYQTITQSIQNKTSHEL